MYRLLWKRPRDEMTDGCNRCAMHGEMSNRHKSSSNRMRKQRNAKGGMNKEIYYKDS